MKTYYVQYRVNGGPLQSLGTLRARSPAGAIGQAATALSDIDGTLDIIATHV